MSMLQYHLECQNFKLDYFMTPGAYFSINQKNRRKTRTRSKQKFSLINNDLKFPEMRSVEFTNEANSSKTYLSMTGCVITLFKPQLITNAYVMPIMPSIHMSMITTKRVRSKRTKIYLHVPTINTCFQWSFRLRSPKRV